MLSIFGRPIPQKLATIEDVSAFAAANYKPKLYEGKIVLFRSTKRGPNEGDDEFLGWGELAKGGVDVNQVPSTPFRHSSGTGGQGVGRAASGLLGSFAHTRKPCNRNYRQPDLVELTSAVFPSFPRAGLRVSRTLVDL